LKTATIAGVTFSVQSDGQRVIARKEGEEIGSAALTCAWAEAKALLAIIRYAAIPPEGE